MTDTAPEAPRKRGRPLKYLTPEAQREAAAERLRKFRARTAAERLHKARTTGTLQQHHRLDTLLPPTMVAAAFTGLPHQTVDPELAEGLAAYPNVASMLQYVHDVRTGKEVVCKLARLAIDRHERDIERIGHRDWPFVFDAPSAERAMKSVQMFSEIKGPRAGRQLHLMPWQRFIIGSAFGWVHSTTRARRFRYVLAYVPRGNGKTTMAAPLALYMLACDREGGAEVYAAAVTRQQARLVFDVACHMAQREGAFRSRFGVEVGAHAISMHTTASTFRPLSRDASTLDGLNVHFAVLDELAQHKTREVHDVLITGTGKRTQPMIAAITTAGSNTSGIGYEQWKYCRAVLNGEITDDMFFGIIYTADEDDDWTSPLTWRKANPNWGVSVMPEVVENLCRRAQQVASQQSAFKQKHLNIWTAAASPWMDMQRWAHMADSTLKIEDFRGEECVIGVDLAAKVDLACVAVWFRRPIEGLLHYYLFLHHYLPVATIESGVNASYVTWHADSWIRASGDEVNDFDLIERDIIALNEAHRIIDVAYDPWQGHQLAGNLDKSDIPVIELRPSTANFSAPLKEMDALVREGRLHHNGDPVLEWCVSCVEVWRDEKDNIYPRKDKNDPLKKIDALIAAVTGMSRWMTIDAEGDLTPTITTL